MRAVATASALASPSVPSGPPVEASTHGDQHRINATHTMDPKTSIWIDLDNTPHVPFFRPIIERLKEGGHDVLVTARDAYNVADLLRLYRLECTTIGRHYGKNAGMKVLGLGVRALQLIPVARRFRPMLAVSHGSRAQTLAASLLGVPSVIIADYEHVTHLTKPDYMVVPELIPAGAAPRGKRGLRQYPGIKEDVYAAAFRPDGSIMGELGLRPMDINVTFRPPAFEAHYHTPLSDLVSDAAMAELLAHERTRVILLPRNDQQKVAFAARYENEMAKGKIIVPPKAVDGLNLVWHSDLVVSGGGTMNREAAALGVPVFSTFRGPIGAVDRYLSDRGRLVMLETPDEVRRRMPLVKRPIMERQAASGESALDSIVAHIGDLARA